MKKYKRQFFKEAKYVFNPDLVKPKEIQNALKDKNLNGYKFAYFDNGIYTFQKKEDNGKYAVVEVGQEQLFDGDLEFMLQHGMTLDANRKRNEIQKYKKSIK